MEPLAAFAGMLIGVMISAILWGLVAIPYKEAGQFKKDCVSMAHGTVDKSADNICVKDGKILFHQ